MADRLLVLNMEADELAVHDPVDGEPITTVETDFNPHEITLSQDGNRAFVACSGADVVNVIETTDWTVTERIAHETFAFPHGWASGPTDLYLTGTRSNRVYVIDPNELTITDHFAVPGELTHMIEVTADGRRGYVANIGSDDVTVLDLDSKEVIDRVAVGSGPEGIGLHPDETHLYVANQEDNDLKVLDVTDAEYPTVAELPLDRTPVRCVWDAAGEHAIVSNRESGSISILVDDHERGGERLPWEIKRLRVGMWAGGVAFKPDGTRAYVANNKSNSISVIDMDRLVETERFATGMHPDGIAYASR